MTGDRDATVAPSPPENRRLIWGLALTQAIGWGTLYFSFAVFIAPMEAELGWTRAELNGALTIGLLTSGLVSIPCGTWVDLRGAHGLMTAGAFVGVAALVGWSQVESLAGFYLVWIGLGVATAATVQDIPFAVVTANVKDYRRGVASILMISGLASGVFLPLTSLLVGQLGWRQALMCLAAVQFLGPVLIYGMVLRGTTGSRTGEELRARGVVAPGAAQLGSPLKAALRRPAFWALAVSIGTLTLTFTSLTFHLIPLLAEQGFSQQAGVIALAIIGPAQIAGRLVIFRAGVTRTARSIGRIMTPVIPCAVLILLVVGRLGYAGVGLFSAIYGMAHGVMTVVRATGIAEILGTRGYGAIGGGLNLVMVVPRTTAPLAMAWLWSLHQSYDLVIMTLIAATAIGAAAFWIAAREEPPATL